MRRLTPDDFRIKAVAGRKFLHIVYPDPATGITRRVSTGTTDYTEAMREKNRFVTAFFTEDAGSAAPEDVTVEDLIAYYNEEYLPKPKKQTKATRTFFGDLHPSAINQDLVNRFVEMRRSMGRKESTIRTELQSILRAALRRAVKDGKWCGPVPEFELPPEPEGRHIYLTEPQAEALLQACVRPHLFVFIHIALATAARKAAIAELTWDRIDFTGGYIEFRTEARKRRKRRKPVPMTDTLRKVLLDEKARQERKGFVTPYVVAKMFDQREPIKYINGSFDAAAERAGIPWVTPHDLRRTAATWMAMDAVPMSEISFYLGHSTVAVTEKHYAVYHPDYHSKGVAALNRRKLTDAAPKTGRYTVSKSAQKRGKMDSYGQDGAESGPASA